MEKMKARINKIAVRMDNGGDGFSEGTVSTDFFGFRTHEVREVEKEKAALSCRLT